jgi:outer membrane protein insertion porin family
VFDRNISAGLDIYRRDYNSFNYLGSSRNTTFQQSTTGFSGRLGVPLTEYASLIGSYTLNYDDVSLDRNQFYLDLDGDGVRTCEPLLAGRYLCEAVGKRLSSILGATLVYDSTDSRLHPTRGRSLSFSTEFAGLGGSVKYLRFRGKGAQYWPLGKGFIFSTSIEGGYIKGLGSATTPGGDKVRLTDRFFLGEPQIRGFDIRGVGPRVLRQPIVADPNSPDVNNPLPLVVTDRNRVADDALGGDAYYLGRAELEIPLGSSGKELGLRPSIFMDVGALWNVTDPVLQNSPFPGGISYQLRDSSGNLLYIDSAGLQTTSPTGAGGVANSPLNQTIDPFQEVFLGDSPSPRVSVGIGVNWNSPFGPFRIDFAKVLKKQPGDDTKSFTFNVGTQF